MVTVGTPRCGIAQPGGEARLVEQACRLVHKVVEIVKDEYLIVDCEEVGHGRTELSEHRGTRARSLEEPPIYPSNLGRIHGIEHANRRPERSRLILAEDAAIGMHGPYRRIAKPARESAGR